eukprot:COSAG01_NODE_777_length_13689_cov_18.035467_5_plen_203_part_00
MLSSLGTRRRLQKGDCDPGAMACRMLFDGQRAFRGTAFLDMPSEAAYNGALEAHQQVFLAADGSKRPCNVRPVKQKQQLAQIAAKPAERAAKMQRLIDARVQEGCARPAATAATAPTLVVARLTGLGPLPFSGDDAFSGHGIPETAHTETASPGRPMQGHAGHGRRREGAASVASFSASVLTGNYLCSVCSCQEILRRNGRG